MVTARLQENVTTRVKSSEPHDVYVDLYNFFVMKIVLSFVSYLKQSRRRRCFEISSSTEETQGSNWNSLPEDVKHNICSGLPLRQVFQFQSISKSFLDISKRHSFLQSRLPRSRTEGNFSPMVFFIDPRSGWHWLGFDLNANEWKRLPSLSFLATPDAIKEFSVAGSGGLLCVNVSKQPGVEQIIVCNPLTRDMRKLQPMNFPRQPVLMTLLLDKDTNNYKVIVAGNATISSGELFRKTEVYDSITREWKVAGDVPGPEFALDEFQAGVVSKGVLYCVGFISTGDRFSHGLLAYHVETEKWIHNWECTLPRLPCCQHVASNTTQLFESEGSIFVYWEQEHSQTVVHFCVAKLETSALSPTQPTMWSVVVSESRVKSRGLLVYPEYLGIGHGHGKVCIFNTLELTGSVYTIGEGISAPQPWLLEPIPTSLLCLGGSTTDLSKSSIVKDRLEETAIDTNRKPLFFPLNPLTFTFEPSFHMPVL
jgi:F-box interacting protein